MKLNSYFMYIAGPGSSVWLANFVIMFMSKMLVSRLLKNSLPLNEMLTDRHSDKKCFLIKLV